MRDKSAACLGLDILAYLMDMQIFPNKNLNSEICLIPSLLSKENLPTN